MCRCRQEDMPFMKIVVDVVGKQSNLKWFRQQQAKHFLKHNRYFSVERLSPSQIRILNRYAPRLDQNYHNFTARNYGDFKCSSFLLDSELRKEQYSVAVRDSFISGCEVSQLASNRPSEDRWFASHLGTEEGNFLFGVLDGHGGEICSHNVSQRLSHYVTAFLLSKEEVSSFEKLCVTDLFDTLLKMPKNYDFQGTSLSKQSFEKLVEERRREDRNGNSGSNHDLSTSSTSFAIAQAFLRLDKDMHNEALRSIIDENVTDIVPYLSSIQSGCCVLACYLTKNSVFVANTGDCRAVAGIKGKNGICFAQPLSADQTAGNPDEVARISHEHPKVEANSLFSHGRLLGILAPLRAFGNAWLKWEPDKIEDCFKFLYGPDASRLIPLFYDTPPYLTAQPELTHFHVPNSGLQFLILATDGLWDLISNEQAVAIVESHMERISKENSVYNSKASFDNAGTALIRYALGGGEDKERLETMLSYPYPEVRMYRDDITVIVIFFDNCF